ncbi:MAG: LacI family DNA-binding transcriptional regulator [Lachnospiraceae bacterium]|jgi:LacI family repressor for deo operon, udp, cdd, tsx, nupC, and nupG
MKNKVNREDIARLAETSVSTVSRALNNSGYVKKEKKERILRAASDLGYFTHPLSSYMQGKQSRQLLYYCDNMRNSFHIHFYQGMLDVASANGYMILVNGSAKFEKLQNFFIDGIILPNEDAAQRYLAEVGENYHLPVVCASYNEANQLSRPLPLVEVDMYQAVITALDYLWSLGHRRIGYGTPLRLKSRGARNRAYKAWVREKGMYTPEEYFYTVKEDSVCPDFFSLGKRCAEQICENGEPITALLAFNDEFALGALKGFSERKYRVPEDISVMGIDGIYSRRYVSPLLTTMNIMPEVQGKACIEVMMEILSGRKYKYITRTPFTIEEGESTAAYKEGKL